MPEYNSNIRALNDVVVDYGLPGGHHFEIDALNAWAVHLGGSGGHQFNIDALNEIIGLVGGSGSFQFDIDAYNEISRALGGGSDFRFVEDALSEISDLPVFGGGGSEWLEHEGTMIDSGAETNVGYLDVDLPTGYDPFALRLQFKLGTGDAVGFILSADGGSSFYLDNNDFNDYRAIGLNAKTGDVAPSIIDNDENSYGYVTNSNVDADKTVNCLLSIFPGATGQNAKVRVESDYIATVLNTEIITTELVAATGRMNRIRIGRDDNFNSGAGIDTAKFTEISWWLFGLATPA